MQMRQRYRIGGRSCFIKRLLARYLMGVGYSLDLVVCTALGVDMFDCVFPTRTARFGVGTPRHATPRHATPHGWLGLCALRVPLPWFWCVCVRARVCVRLSFCLFIRRKDGGGDGGIDM